MFRNRRTQQKPTDEFYATFKASFPHLAAAVATGSPPSSSSTTTQGGTDAITAALSHSIQATLAGSLSHSLTMPVHHTEHLLADDFGDQNPTPRPSNEPFRFTPSLLDPNSYAFASFANQPPGYYTPTSGGTTTLYHPQAGDLHTPNLGFGFGTPLSMPTSLRTVTTGQPSTTVTSSASSAATDNRTILHPHGHDRTPQLPHQQLPPQFRQPTGYDPTFPSQSLAPLHFSRRHSGLPNLEHGIADGPLFPQSRPQSQPQLAALHHGIHDSEHMQLDTVHPLHLPVHPSTIVTAPTLPLQDNIEGHRFHVTLNAPTAMVRHADEIPITYLNKGQVYTLTVVDSMASKLPPTPVKYRTFVRISFEDEQQRLRPAACWQLWKEGRGTSEAHQRGGKLQAVEFVSHGQSQSQGCSEQPQQPSKSTVEVELASFDGFCVTWSPQPHQPVECSITMRFNFLSTDFSHSKGVKGIPVRLCAKTEQLSLDSNPIQASQPQVCHCQVKLFRDHGAERKLANDVAHVKKSIEKLKQQIAQAESGFRDNAKRRQSMSSMGKPAVLSRTGKVQKHKRTWSTSSTSSSTAVVVADSSTAAAREAADEDLQIRLVTLQDMFGSTLPTSVLSLLGDEHDDPDLYPVQLSAELADTAPSIVRSAIGRLDSGESSAVWEKQSGDILLGEGSPFVSPTPSSLSLASVSGISARRTSGLHFQLPVPLKPASSSASSSGMPTGEWRKMQQTAIGPVVTAGSQPISSEMGSSASRPIKVARKDSTGGSTTGWVEAIGYDPSYQPPPDPVIKPVACFYIQPRVNSKAPKNKYYRAVYLMQRTLNDFVRAVAHKSDVNPTEVIRTVRVLPSGLTVLFDDDVVHELVEGQDMLADFCDLGVHSPVHLEWAPKPMDVQVDGDIPTTTSLSSGGYELRLIY